MRTRDEFIARARQYIGLPHRHQGRAHLGGNNQAVDCVGLLVCVAEDLNLSDRAGIPIRRGENLQYGPSPTRSDVHEACKQRLILRSEAPDLGVPLPGDVITLLVKYRERDPGVTCHVAIVTNMASPGAPPTLGMIHSLASLGRVVEHELGPKWMRRIQGIFSVPGLP